MILDKETAVGVPLANHAAIDTHVRGQSSGASALKMKYRAIL